MRRVTIKRVLWPFFVSFIRSSDSESIETHKSVHGYDANHADPFWSIQMPSIIYNWPTTSPKEPYASIRREMRATESAMDDSNSWSSRSVSMCAYVKSDKRSTLYVVALTIPRVMTMGALTISASKASKKAIQQTDYEFDVSVFPNKWTLSKNGERIARLDDVKLALRYAHGWAYCPSEGELLSYMRSLAELAARGLRMRNNVIDSAAVQAHVLRTLTKQELTL